MKTSLIVSALGAFVTLTSLPAWAEERRCTGSIGAVSLDNIFVPDGATCTLTKTRAKGSVVVGTGARLTAKGVSINGNIQAEGARFVRITSSSIIGGSVQVVQGYEGTIKNSRVNGDVQFDENTGPVTAVSNNVGGNMQVVANSGGVELINNQMKGNLQCKENSPPPTGYGNRAAGKEDQCARL